MSEHIKSSALTFACKIMRLFTLPSALNLNQSQPLLTTPSPLSCSCPPYALAPVETQVSGLLLGFPLCSVSYTRYQSGGPCRVLSQQTGELGSRRGCPGGAPDAPPAPAQPSSLRGGNEPKVRCFLKTDWKLLPLWEARRQSITAVVFQAVNSNCLLELRAARPGCQSFSLIST